MRKVLAGLFCLSVLIAFVIPLLLLPSIHDANHPVYDFVESTASKDAVVAARTYEGLVRSQDVPAIERASTKVMMSDAYRKVIPVMAGYMPAGKPVKARVAQWQSMWQSDGKTSETIILLTRYSDRILISTTRFATSRSTRKVEGFRINMLTDADLKQIDFRFETLNNLRIAVLSMAFVVVAFTMLMLYRCLSTKGIRFGWLWAVFISVGFMRFNYNWLNSQISFQPISVFFPAAGYTQDLAMAFSPYIAIPFGALLFYVLKIGKTVKTAASVSGG
jgi:hypothetical protein